MISEKEKILNAKINFSMPYLLQARSLVHTLAWEYYQFLSSNGYTAQAKQNEEKIPNDRMVILEQGQPMPITLNHPLQILQEDFRKSREEILKSQRIVRGLQSDKL